MLTRSSIETTIRAATRLRSRPVAEAGIHLEFCPTSNLRLGCIPRIEAHPLLAARRRGLRFSINTDDPGAFQCSLTSELELAVRHFGLTRADLLAIHADTVAAGFHARRAQCGEPVAPRI
jgi:adenosine deaminase